MSPNSREEHGAIAARTASFPRGHGAGRDRIGWLAAAGALRDDPACVQARLASPGIHGSVPTMDVRS